MTEEKRLDGQCLFIQKDIEKDEHVDYVFTCDVWGKDPRFKQRGMKVGQVKGLFRIDKVTQESTLLYPMEGDNSKSCYRNALSKVLKKQREENQYTDKTAFQSG
ncbi:MAG: hypothetical protein AB2597_01990 [Candidatus Thiodiazotropha sp.]